MNYQKVYNNLIQYRQKAILNKSQCYCECHHILPRSLGGSDNKTNLVNLTAREHYIAHRLLEKITKEKFGNDSIEHRKMLHAIWRMMHDLKHKTIIKSREYEFLRTEYSRCLSIQMSGSGNPMYGKSIKDYMSPEKFKLHCEKISKSNTGKIVSIETRQKISKSNKGKIVSKECREKISKTLTGYKRPKNICEKISKSLKGFKRPPRTLEHRQKLGKALKGKCAGEKNGCFGRKWMHHPITQDKVYAKKDEIQHYLELGYIFGVNDLTKNKNKGKFIIINGKRIFIPKQ